MQRVCAIAAVIAIAAVPVGLAGAAPTKLDATMNGAAEVPRSDSSATGSARFTVSSNGRKIRYQLRARGLSGAPQAAHLHLGAPGEAGPVLISIATQQFSLPRRGTLTARQFTAVDSVDTFRKAVRAVRAGRTYVNIHTAMYPGGEIRGQVRRAG